MLTWSAKEATEFRLQKKMGLKVPIHPGYSWMCVCLCLFVCVRVWSLYLICLCNSLCCVEFCICLGFLTGQESTICKSEKKTLLESTAAGIYKKKNTWIRSECSEKKNTALNTGTGVPCKQPLAASFWRHILTFPVFSESFTLSFQKSHYEWAQGKIQHRWWLFHNHLSLSVSQHAQEQEWGNGRPSQLAGIIHAITRLYVCCGKAYWGTKSLFKL